MSLAAVLGPEAASKNSCVQEASDHEVSVKAFADELKALADATSVFRSETAPAIQKEQRTVDVPLVHHMDRIVDVPVVKQCQGPTINTSQKTGKVPQSQYSHRAGPTKAAHEWVQQGTVPPTLEETVEFHQGRISECVVEQFIDVPVWRCVPFQQWTVEQIAIDRIAVAPVGLRRQCRPSSTCVATPSTNRHDSTEDSRSSSGSVS